MRAAGNPDVAAALATGARVRLDVSSWLGAAYLGRVPIVSGSWEVVDDGDSKTGGKVTFQVPASREWIPSGPKHPLGRFGQQLVVRAGVTLPGQPDPVWLQMSRWRLRSTMVEPDVITVEAQSLLTIVEDARLLVPFVVDAGSSRTAVLKKLLTEVTPCMVTAPDKTMNAVVFERERIDALVDICEGWGARFWIDDAGMLRVDPKWGPIGTPVASWTDGPGGTLRSLRPVESEARGFNGYVVTNQPKGNESPTTAVAVVPEGPMAWRGPYGMIPGFYSSPSLPADVTTLRSVAEQLLQRSQERQQRWTATIGPDPRIQVGDVVSCTSHRLGVVITGRVMIATHSTDRTVLTIGGAV